jgi:hypothetical protein
VATSDKKSSGENLKFFPKKNFWNSIVATSDKIKKVLGKISNFSPRKILEFNYIEIFQKIL